ncbi:hypothetical protein TRSC58_07289 [Trypanosoma rangeli SC58]|uniref:Uncharacterized protein n=1 Tax=Trypanosoma rangeli SC58 TaxID=429131 RepID=A0A061IT61_TRYRA|nr:hypothetical protein TRSC58_07289 [Trypanosoma rangeli SC58]
MWHWTRPTGGGGWGAWRCRRLFSLFSHWCPSLSSRVMLLMTIKYRKEKKKKEGAGRRWRPRHRKAGTVAQTQG